ncbi:MAG: ABC transporter substrate-binding protein, partial [Pseudomonadota bacterium]
MRTIRRLVLFGATALIGAMPIQAGAQSALSESGLIGELEGITIIEDPSQWPTSFSESPKLAELVAKGELPPVEERLPEDLMVIQPVHEIGQYGGIVRRGFTGPADNENGNRIQSSDRPILVDHTGTVPRPSLAKGWELSEDGKTFTLHLRKGMRWSDGAPLTADDFIFWFEDIYGDPDLTPTPMTDLTPEGKPGRMVKVDDHTVNFEFDVPFPLFEELMMGDTLIGGGQAVRQSGKRSQGGYAPAHYLKQFLPKYAGGEDAANEAAKAAGYDNWVSYIHFAKDWSLNPDLPVVGPFKTVQAINNPVWVMERNPYYWAVDTEGNQLPYLDGITMTLAEDLEVLNLRAIAGDYDVQERHVDLGKLPVILENQEKGGYTVRLDMAFNGADAVFQFNQTYDADPEIA